MQAQAPSEAFAPRPHWSRSFSLADRRLWRPRAQRPVYRGVQKPDAV